MPPSEFFAMIGRREAIVTTLAFVAAASAARAQEAAADDPWPSLKEQIFGAKPLTAGDAVIGIDAPYRAEDAAMVPLGLRSLLPSSNDGRRIDAITLVIDQNPSPLAARFSPGPNSGMTSLSTRVRVDSYTKIHAVAEVSDGKLYVAERFVKAAGGCSAPAAKAEASAIPLGTMRWRQFPAQAGSDRPQAQLMIRHPNFSGMQMDQVTRLYVPAHFITSVRIWQGSDLLLAVESGISIAENPSFRFDYRPNGAASFRAEAQDSKGNSFSQEWPALPA